LKTTLLAPAKINLELYVFDRNENGLHSVLSNTNKIALFDEVTVECDPNREGIEIEIHCTEDWQIPTDKTNTCHKAIRYFFRGRKAPFVKVNIVKNIPPQSGLGGASSNAAAVLCALQKWFPQKKLLNDTVALTVGSDVPLFLSNSPKNRIRGFGNIVEPITYLENKQVLLVMPKRAKISTDWAFRELDMMRAQKVAKQQKQNDFTEVVCKKSPEVTEMLNIFRNSTSDFFGLTGSGAAVFALFKNGFDLSKIIKNIDQQKNWICKTEYLTRKDLR
jgi:4-diphosphocytidyl-2-C-methyl-D-erythritol kinase